MSKLYFTPVDQAFTLGSSQIKDSQEEIAQLTKLILESNAKVKPKNEIKKYPSEQVFNKPQQFPQPVSTTESIDYNLMKVMGHPKFDEIVKNYALINHPEWFVKETVYVPMKGTDNKIQEKSFFKPSVSYFGNQYQSTICSDVKRYTLFFIICVIIFLSLSLYF